MWTVEVGGGKKVLRGRSRNGEQKQERPQYHESHLSWAAAPSPCLLSYASILLKGIGTAKHISVLWHHKPIGRHESVWTEYECVCVVLSLPGGSGGGGGGGVTGAAQP